MIEYLKPFDAAVISWQGKRPVVIKIQVLRGEWSPWLTYAKWLSDGQWGAGTNAWVDVDVIGRGEGLRVRIKGECEHIWVHTLGDGAPTFDDMGAKMKLSCGPLWSQVTMGYSHQHRLCSPTSVCHALGVMGQVVHPLEMAKKVYDAKSGVYGNWAFAAAAANEWVQGCQVRWLKGGHELENFLSFGEPVVVSVCSERYPQGHLMTVIGLGKNGVDVLDSGCEEVEQKICWMDFERMWRARHYLSYTFKREN